MKKIVSGFYPFVLGALLVTTAILAGISFSLLKDRLYAATEAHMRSLARVLASVVAQEASRDPAAADFGPRIRKIAQAAGARITVVDRDGRVIAETDRDEAGMDNHAGRPEIIAALEGREAVSIRHSASLDLPLLYVAVPVMMVDRPPWVVRAASPVRLISAELLSAMVILGAAMAGMIGGVSLFLYRAGQRISRPLKSLCDAADRFASGQLDFRAAVNGPGELSQLARRMNGMAVELAERMTELDRRREEAQTILNAMSEALILLDTQLKVSSCNPAAARLFGSADGTATSADLTALTGSSELFELVGRALAGGTRINEEVTLFRDPPVLMQAHASLIKNGSGGTSGVLLVLNDVTRLNRLETIRRDFVSNVSHELKTPVTSIKGFVETLTEGALDDPKAARRFLKIIERQTGRLEAIIDDLLSLARIEQGERVGIAKSEYKLRSILEDAADICESKARSKKMKIRIDCPKASVMVNANLLEQAVINLIDNAVKFSPEGTPVDVSARLQNDRLEIAVKDEGRGIPARDLPRLFERFYVVDKARSRELGGTGLGLSIVRHIALVHGGTVAVESWEDSGSIFTISLPV